MTCHFIPRYLLERLATATHDEEVAHSGQSTLTIDEQLRSRRTAVPPVVSPDVPPESVRGSGEDAWSVYTANGGSSLPGTPVRSAGEPASGDAAVDEAYSGVEASLAFFREVLDRASYDGRGAPVISTVHYEQNYDNAFWDGRQLVFGDGDGKVFTRFTKPIDVLGHEFSHAVTQYTAGLTYSGQSGALNESVSDVFGSCVKQRVRGESARDADWLIGEGIFLPSVHGRALRSMAQPGTAYDDPVLGKDPQVGSMSEYVHTTSDNGGVHLNSGIPNRAFYLAATALGGSSWDQAGPIWYSALTSGIGADTDFAGFAAATARAAEAVSPAAADAVRSAWDQVGVSVPGGTTAGTTAGTTPGTTPGTASAGDASSEAGGGPGSGQSGGHVVSVRRSGGFAGLDVSGEVRLGDDPRTPEIEQLLDRIDLRTLAPAPPQPDRFVYAFNVRGSEVMLGEQEMTPELHRLAALVLDY